MEIPSHHLRQGFRTWTTAIATAWACGLATSSWEACRPAPADGNGDGGPRERRGRSPRERDAPHRHLGRALDLPDPARRGEHPDRPHLERPGEPGRLRRARAASCRRASPSPICPPSTRSSSPTTTTTTWTRATVERLAREHRPWFFVPLGLREWFRRAGNHRRRGDGLVGPASTSGGSAGVHARPALLRADAHRPVPAPLGLVGRAGRLEALLLRRGHGLRLPIQGDRRTARAVRPGDDPDRRLRHASRRASEPREPRGGGPALRGRRAACWCRCTGERSR